MSAEGWKTVTIERSPIEILDGDRGHNYPKQEEFHGNEYCLFLNTSNVTTEGFNFEKTMFITNEKDHLLKKGKLERFDIVLTTRGTVGNVAYYDEYVPYENIRINSGMVIFRNNRPEDISSKYFYQFLRSPLFRTQVASHSSGSAQPQLPIKDLKKIELPLPPLPTQTRIAAILSALDDKIELNRQTNATLEVITQTIFKEWFVDFRFPGATGEMQDSEFGPIPVGWRAGTLEDICELNPRLPLKKGTIAKYVEMKNLSQLSLSVEEPREREFSSGSKFQNGDTLLAKITPCLENGKTGFVDFLNGSEVGWGSTEFIALRGRHHINPYFVYCLSRLTNFRDFAIQSMVGSSGRQRVVESILSEYPIVIPDKKAADLFFTLMDKIFFQVKNNSDQSTTLAKIRDALLPKLMAGEIEV